MTKDFWIDMILMVVDKDGHFRHVLRERDEGMIEIAYEDYQEGKWVEKEQVTVSVDRADALAEQLVKLADHLRKQDEP